MSSPARVLAISPDNQLLAIATDHDEQIWELPTQKRLAVLHTPFDCYCLMFLTFSPDSAMLASADGDTAIRIYDARTGTLRSTASDLLLESLALDFSSDSKSLFVGGGDQTISIINSLTAKSGTRFQNNPAPSADSWLPATASKLSLPTTYPSASMMPASPSCCFGTLARARCAQNSSTQSAESIAARAMRVRVARMAPWVCPALASAS